MDVNHDVTDRRARLCVRFCRRSHHNTSVGPFVPSERPEQHRRARRCSQTTPAHAGAWANARAFEMASSRVRTRCAARRWRCGRRAFPGRRHHQRQDISPSPTARLDCETGSVSNRDTAIRLVSDSYRRFPTALGCRRSKRARMIR
jgi:hypothetical protein